MIFAQDNTGDIDLSSGTIALVVDPDVETAQRLSNRFTLWAGEWSFDTRIGVPYLQFVFQQREANIPLVESLVRRIIRETPGVAEIKELVSSYVGGAERSLTIQVTVQSQSGAILSGQLGGDFIVEV